MPWTEDWSCAACAGRVSQADGIPCLAPGLINTKEGFDPAYFDELVRHEDTNFWFVNRAKLINHLVATHFPAPRRLLEIGCGTGAVLTALRKACPDARMMGSELHPAGLAHAAGRLGKHVELVQMDARSIPARDHFDVIGAFDVLEHVPQDERVVGQMWQALRPGGGVIVTVPQHRWLWSPEDDAAHHQRRYARGEMEGKLTDAGFRVVFSSSYTSLLLPVMFASRLAKRLKGGESAPYEAMSEFKIHPVLNGLLGGFNGLEVALTKIGVRWPLGGSRVVVAVKD